MRTLSAALWAAVLALASPAGASTFDQRFESQSAAASPRPALTFEQRYASQAQTVHWSNELLYRGVFSSWRALEPEGLHGPRPVARRAVMHPRVASLGPVRITHPNARAQGGMFSPQSIAKDMLQQKLSYRLGEMGVQYPGIPVCTAFSFGSLVVEGVKNHEHWTPLDTLGNLVLISLPDCIFPFTALKNAKSPLEALLIAANGAAPYFVPAYAAIPWQVRQTIIDGVVKAASPPHAAAQPPPRKKKQAQR